MGNAGNKPTDTSKKQFGSGSDFKSGDLSQSTTPRKDRSLTFKRKESAVSDKKIAKLFDKYKDPEADEILIEGSLKFVADLGVPLDDVVLVVISWHLQAKTMGIFTKPEWISGFKSLEMDSLEKIKQGLPVLRAQINDSATLPLIYKYSFDFFKDSGVRTLDIETADRGMDILIGTLPWIQHFRKFLQTTSQTIINRDQWNAALEFAQTVGPDLQGYEEDGAWPILIDEFVVWFQETKGLTDCKQ